MDMGAFLQAILSMVGEENAQSLTQEQIDVYKKQIAQMAGIPLPEMPNITPEQLGQAAAAGVTADPRLKQTENDTLADFGNIYSQGGLDFRTRADLNDALGQSASNAQADQQSIRQRLQGTGQLGSGADIAMSMAGASSAAQRGNSNAFKTAALGEQRKMDALKERGSLASQMRGEQYSEDMKAAMAKDARDQWNAESRSRAQQYNAGLPQQQFQNQVTKVTGGFAPGSNLAQAYANSADSTRGLWSGLGYAANKAWNGGPGSGSGGQGGGGGGGGGYANADDPNSVYKYGTNYGGSDPSEWEGW
jgi:hypothetical protein